MTSKELDTGVVDPPREIVESESELKEEVYRLKHQMAEMYQAWVRGHPPPSFPANYPENPAFIPPLSQAQDPITIDLSPQHAPGFTPYRHYPGTSSQTFHTPPAKTTAYPAPTSAPVFVAPPRATLHRSSSEPVFQAPDTQYYVPEPTFKVADPYSHAPRFEPLVKTEKPSRNVEQDEMFRKVKSLEQSLKNMQGIGSQVSVAYKDLCLFPDVQLPAGFKMPKFDPYDGHGDPAVHLRGFCSNMRGANGKDELLMAYFSQSLSGAALECTISRYKDPRYSVELPQYHVHHAQSYAQPPPYSQWRAPTPQNLYTPPQLYQNPTGPSFRPKPDYRKERQQRKETFTPLGESYTSLFQRLRQLDVLRPIEPKIPNPSPRNLDYSLRCAYCSDAPGHDTEKCWHLKRAIQELIDTNQIVVQSPEAPNINQNPLPTHAETHMIEIVHKDGETKNFSKSVMMIRASESNPIKALDSAKAMSLAIKGVSEKPSALNVKPSILVVKGPPVDVEANQERQKVVVPGPRGKPVIIVEGARVTPVIIKPVTQLPMVDTKAVPWNYKQVIVTYKGKEVEEEVNGTGGLTRSGRCFTPEELRKTKPSKDGHIPVKKPVTEEEAEEFLKKMKMQDYSIVEQVLADNGSSANICPLSTLQKLKIGTERIHINNVCVRGFDGGWKDSVGDIMLNLSIGPVEFTMEFQVLDVAASYNLLLGRPWIHAAKAIPSSLHQMVKFEWDRQEIVVHGDENLSAYNDTIVPFIEVEDDKGPWVYQMFETVSVGKIPEGECILGPKIPSASVMVANEMLKNGFLSGKGPGSSLQGIVHPVCPRESFGTFGLGFTLTGKDVKKAKSLKGKAWSLPKPVPHISNSFVKPGVAKRPISAVPKPVVDFDEELIKRFQSLFDEVNMVEIGSFYAGFNDMTCMRNFQPNLKSQSNSEITIQEVEGDDETEYDEEAAFEEVSRELKHFEEKPKPNLNETEAINLGDQNNVRETKIIPKKDGKTRVCVDYRDRNKASPKDNFPLLNIHILIDNCAKHEIGSFVDCYAGYHQILMDEEDAEKTAFITP
ncbi:uncharacterized protein [Nicotiana tomentosiformis]|uniref:uncharacterized protein n=1 Tax=Nicotiana tomentosiformis TaxID=4098 RepID=UPI00388CD39D